MDLKDQVTSLEISKKLKELGVKQDSLFYWTSIIDFSGEKADWISIRDDEYEIDMFDTEVNVVFTKGCSNCNYAAGVTESYSAFTVAELGEMLLYNLDDGEDFWYPVHTKQHSYFKISLLSDAGLQRHHIIEHKSEADARAKMIIYMIENKLINDEWKKNWLNKGLK